MFNTPHFQHSAFSTLRTFNTPHFQHSAFLTLRIFHTPHFHTPHFPHSAFSTLRIFNTPHFQHSAFSTLRDSVLRDSAFSCKPFLTILCGKLGSRFRFRSFSFQIRSFRFPFFTETRSNQKHHARKTTPSINSNTNGTLP